MAVPISSDSDSVISVNDSDDEDVVRRARICRANKARAKDNAHADVPLQMWMAPKERGEAPRKKQRLDGIQISI